MAIGDIAGDTADTYAARAKQNSFDVTNTPAKYLMPPAGQQPPPGPIGRAQQQLPASQPNNLGNIDLTPLDPVSAAQQSGPTNLANAFPSALAPKTANPQPAAVTPSPATPPPNQPNNLANISMVTPIPAGPLPPPMTNLAQIGSTIGANALGMASPAAKPQSLADAAPVGVTPTATSPAVDPANIASVSAQSLANAANLPASTPPLQPPAAAPAGPASLDIYRSTGAGTDAAGGTRAGGQIVATTGPNGEASFSNAAGAHAAAQNLGDIINNPVPPAANPNASLASLGSAANLGDGIGTFSQAQDGDAALATGRFQKAQDVRDSYKNKDRLDQALGAKWSADHTNVVHDGRKPLSLADIKFDQGQQQSQARADSNVNNAQGLLDAGIKDRTSEQQLRQSTRLEDALTAAVAPNATPEQKQRYQTLVDPTGAMGLDRQLKVANINNAVLQGQSKQQQIQQSTQSQAQGIQDKTASRKGQLATFDQALGSVDEILGKKQNPNNPNGPNTDEDKGLTASLGRIDGLTPTAPGSPAADFQARLETLKAQTFIPQVAALKGMGALSDAEGAKLSASVGALSTKMSEDAFRKSLHEVRTTLQSARDRVTQAGPAVGTIEDSHIFLGGDPSSPKSWRAQ